MMHDASYKKVFSMYTWKDVEQIVPEFVKWIRVTYGNLPDGEVDINMYAKYLQEYIDATR